MTVLTVGRFGTDSDVNIDVESLSSDGDGLSLDGSILPGAVTDPDLRGHHMRDQLRGLARNVDEPVIPVTWSEDPAVDGFYRVRGVNVESTGATAVEGIYRFSLDLERVSSSSAPFIESHLIFGGPIPHGWTYTSTNGSHWIPSTYTSYNGANSFGAVSTTRATSDGGTVTQFVPGATVTSTAYEIRTEWTLDAADYYVGAARIEVEVSSGVWRPLIGRQIPKQYVDARTWRVNNGAFMMYPDASGVWRNETYVSAAWETDDGWVLSNQTYGGNFGDVTQASILRNSPEEVTVRCVLDPGSTYTYLATLDVTLRAGDTMAMWACTVHDIAYAGAWRVARATTTASSAVTSGGNNIGIRATSNDADGNRYVLTSDYANTLDTTNGRLTCGSSRTQARFGLGTEINGSSSVAPNTALGQCEMWLSQPHETRRVRTR